MNTMRPDEISAEERARKSKQSSNLISSAIVGAGSAALGMGAANKILPFLNELIPADLAMKGISKINPKLGNFLSQGKSMGLDIKEGLQFIKDKITPDKNINSSNPKNIIEEHAPEVHEFLVDMIGKGLQPLKAAFQLSQDSKFKRPIQELQKKTGKSFSDLVTAVFGAEDLGPRSQMERNQQPQEQQQVNQGDSALISALDKILKM